MMDNCDIHAAALIFPEMSSEEYAELKDSIKNEGFDHAFPIILFENKILDGRHRYKICNELDVTPVFEDYTGPSPIDFVLRANLKRRHLTASQKAVVAVDLLPLAEAEARKRQGTRTDIVENLPESSEGRARDKVGDALGVSGRYIQEAKRLKETDPDMFEKVRNGKISLSGTKISYIINNSGENEWYTPPKLIELVKAVMGRIDLDPASSDTANEIVQANKYFTIKDDGLKQRWFGKVWLNPPYGQPFIEQFSDAVVTKITTEGIEEMCVLVNNATETKWFQQMLKNCQAVCFIKGRIQFIREYGGLNSPLQGQAVLYFGSNHDKFEEQFGKEGIILFPNCTECQRLER